MEHAKSGNIALHEEKVPYRKSCICAESDVYTTLVFRVSKTSQRGNSRKYQLRLMERETGIEPATNGLGSRYSTIELLPLKELFGLNSISLNVVCHDWTRLRHGLSL
jgi:hypothetical protein